ncbi:MFS transporter [Metabacillus halosaccharovorans]|uniref:MFS transporter n=1 Tax=Metabacillus halosaccharovorans TaxID=930124 RepID=UPI001C1F2F1A|nr:MFS transporter [Metabacillus halosaccharovorans]MBU7595770.1 glucuronide permease [Metabacillus halosaccharovorans]
MANNIQTGKMLRGRQDNSKAKLWELFLYPSGAIVNNYFLMLMMVVSYYAAGIVGLGTVVASFIITGSRVLDSITDPVIGFIIDKTQGRFGKVSIFLFLGFIIMAGSSSLIYFTTHLVPDSLSIIYFIILYAIFIIGYTFYSIASRAGYSILTRDPKQRPIFGAAEAVYGALYATAASLLLSNYLAPKYGGFSNVGLFQELTLIIIGVSAIFATIGLLIIWPKDRVENYYQDTKQEPIKFKDMWSLLKGNRPLQLFIVAAATDKLAMQIKGNQIVGVMVFGIVIGNFAVMGQIQAMSLLPSLLVILFGFRYANKNGSKKGLIITTWLSIITALFVFLVLWLGDPTQINLTNWGVMTTTFVIGYVLLNSLVKLPLAFVIPMIPDIIDYEAYKSGRFVPGLISSVYSFIDKAVSSLAQTIIGLLLAIIGFKAAFPDVDTPYTEGIFWMAMFLNFGGLIIAWILTLIAMKFYNLDKNKMEEIRVELEKRREQNSESIEEAKSIRDAK